MSFHRFFDYAYIKPFQVNRLLGDDGSPPARIVFCCMAQLPFSGRLDLDKDEVPNTRNRIVEVVESAYLKALRHTIPGRQLYGDGRTMSAREFMKFAKENGEGQGLGYFDNGIGRKNSKSKKNSTPGGGVALSAPGKARATKTTGANVHLRDPLDPTRLALFEFYYVRGRGDEQEIIKGEGPLCWGGGYSPYLRTTLNGQDAIKINGEKRKQNQVHPNVATDLPIKYVPSDGSDPVELGNVVGGEFEKFHPKPTTWVRMSGIPQNIGRTDVKDVLKEALKDDEDDESIVRVERNGDGGTIDVQFAKVWEARGCATLLNKDEKLFGEKIAVELLYAN